MEWSEMVAEIRQTYGSEYLLRQLAEECAELTEAALKLIRARRRETPVTEDEAWDGLVEEMADVAVMYNAVFNSLLTGDMRQRRAQIQEEKQLRMYLRLMKGGAGDDAVEAWMAGQGGRPLP